MSEDMIVIAARLGAGAVAAIFAIAAWSRTREAPWLFFVLGIIAAFAETLWSVGHSLGITESIVPRRAAALAAVVLSVLPSLFWTTACAALLVKKSR